MTADSAQSAIEPSAVGRPQIFLASDHRGFDQKQELHKALADKDYAIIDLGPAQENPDDDFNDAALKVAKAVVATEPAYGILICGSAHGVAMQSNRFRKIRAITAYDERLAKIGREHEDANVLCLSADFTDPAENIKIAETFLNTPPLKDERYLRRIKRLDEERSI